MKTKKMLLSLALILWSAVAWADSPLTSTHFAQCYSDNAMVAMAQSLDGDLNTTLLNYLADKKSPVAERLAIINAVGWNFDGKTTGAQLFEFLSKRYKAKDEKALAKKLDAGTLAVYAYAKAMSNYFDVNDAMALAGMAVSKNKKKSFSVNLIAALIRTQYYLDNDWSMIYPIVNQVLNDGSLKLDMRQSAIDSIMEYIGIYEGEK